MIEKGYTNIVLADLSQGMLDEAKKRLDNLSVEHNAILVKSDITNMKEFKSDTFDYAFSQYDAVSYSMEPGKAMRELARVAKKGSYITISLDTK